MKTLFTSIRRRDFEKVKSLIEKDPSLVNSVAKAPPKKDDGQSPLQVAFKTGNFDIADYLIDMGADVNYIEKKSTNKWKAPVIHDAIIAATHNVRFKGDRGIMISKDQSERAFSSLKKLIEAGANVNATDSFKGNCLMRFAVDAQGYNLENANKEFIQDMSKISKLLISSGADINEKTGEEKKSVVEMFGGTPVSMFFK